MLKLFAFSNWVMMEVLALESLNRSQLMDWTPKIAMVQCEVTSPKGPGGNSATDLGFEAFFKHLRE